MGWRGGAAPASAIRDTGQMNTVGIRREDKNQWERRVPLVPEDVADLSRDQGVEFLVQPSALRIIPDEAYQRAGADIHEDLSGCGVVLAVKEIPAELLQPGVAYVFFSHTIKGQPQGMPLLQRALDVGCTLVDYERIIDDHDRRLVAFGRHAGLAGTIGALWALGRRWLALGVPTPLLALQQAVAYPDLATALSAVDEAGRRIASEGMPPETGPLVIGVTGYGKVAHGAAEVLERLPLITVEPPDLTDSYLASASDRAVHVARFAEQDTVARADGGPFDLSYYLEHPDRHESTFAAVLPRLSLLINAMFWDPRSPRLVTVEQLRDLPLGSRTALIADLSCDIEGGVEATVTATTPGDPTFVFDPVTRRATPGFDGPGIAVLAVDNLPCELPLDASLAFSHALRPFVGALSRTDFTVPFDELTLPPEVARAVVAHRGQLTSDYEYLSANLTKSGR